MKKIVVWTVPSLWIIAYFSIMTYYHNVGNYSVLESILIGIVCLFIIIVVFFSIVWSWNAAEGKKHWWRLFPDK